MILILISDLYSIKIVAVLSNLKVYTNPVANNVALASKVALGP